MICSRAVFFAAVGVLFCSFWSRSAQGEPQVTIGIDLFDTSNVPLVPIAPNTYSIHVHEEFRVGVHARLSNPNWTDSFHTDVDGNVLPPIELGLLAISTNLVSVGAPNVISPLAYTATDPPRWGISSTSAARVFVPGGQPWMNLVDRDKDGDLDPSAIGFIFIDPIVGGYGVDLSDAYMKSLQIGLGTETDVLLGGYLASATGNTQLRFGTPDLSPPASAPKMHTTVMAFFDPPGQDNELRAREVTDVVIETFPTIIVHAPEPAGAMSAALGLLVLLARAPSARSRRARR